MKAEKALSDVIEDLDKKLDRVLKKQEHEYLKGYSLYVKQKERELRELISKLNDKNSNASLKDQIIYEKTQTIAALTREQNKIETEKTQLKERIKFFSARADAFEQDKNFLQNQIVDCKRQNKLLKLAIGRLQEELDGKDKIIRDAGIGDETFLTTLKAG